MAFVHGHMHLAFGMPIQAVPSPPHTQRVLVNVQAARRYRIYSEAVDYTGRGRSPRRGIVNSRGGYPVRAETPDVN